MVGPFENVFSCFSKISDLNRGMDQDEGNLMSAQVHNSFDLKASDQILKKETGCGQLGTKAKGLRCEGQNFLRKLLIRVKGTVTILMKLFAAHGIFT